MPSAKLTAGGSRRHGAAGDGLIGKGKARGRGARRRRGPPLRSVRPGPAVAAPVISRPSRRRSRRPARRRPPAAPAGRPGASIAASMLVVVHRQARRHPVPAALAAAALRRPAAGSQRPDRRRRPTGPIPCRSPPSSPMTTAGRFVGLFQARRDDADDAGMPAVARGPDQRRRPARALRPVPALRRAPGARSRAVRC